MKHILSLAMFLTSFSSYCSEKERASYSNEATVNTLNTTCLLHFHNKSFGQVIDFLRLIVDFPIAVDPKINMDDLPLVIFSSDTHLALGVVEIARQAGLEFELHNGTLIFVKSEAYSPPRMVKRSLNYLFEYRGRSPVENENYKMNNDPI